MNTIKRSLLYLKRKKAQTIVMLLLLMILASGILSCLSIYSAAMEATHSLRQTVGNTFTLDIDFYADADNWKTEVEDYGGYSSEYRGPTITYDMIDRILAIDGITTFSYRDISSADVLAPQGSPADIMIPDNDISKKIGAESDNNQPVYGVADSAYDPYFYDGTFQLAEGRHIGKEDTGVCMISEDYARLNGLSLGETIFLTPASADREHYHIGEEDRQASTVGVLIIGIFHIEAEQADPSAITKWDMAENLVFADYTSLKTLYTWWRDISSDNGEISSAVTFYVQDAEQTDTLMSQIKQTLDVDWNSFILEKRNDSYVSFSASLMSLRLISGILVAVGIVAGLLILALVLMLRTKARTREMGLYLSAGMPKGKVWGQLAMESCWLFLPAMLLACFISRALAGGLGNLLLPSAAAGTHTVGEQYTNSFGVVMQTPAISHLEVGLSLFETGATGLLLLGIILMAVSLAAIPVLRMKPRKILSTLS